MDAGAVVAAGDVDELPPDDDPHPATVHARTPTKKPRRVAARIAFGVVRDVVAIRRICSTLHQAANPVEPRFHVFWCGVSASQTAEASSVGRVARVDAARRLTRRGRRERPPPDERDATMAYGEASKVITRVIHT
jgi:hypothetical protein